MDAITIMVCLCGVGCYVCLCFFKDCFMLRDCFYLHYLFPSGRNKVFMFYFTFHFVLLSCFAISLHIFLLLFASKKFQTNVQTFLYCVLLVKGCW